MTSRIGKIAWIMVSPVLVYWGWVMVTDVGRPYRATCYSAKPKPCFTVSALPGEYQAQGRGR